MDRPTYQQALLQISAYRSVREVINGVLTPYGLNVTQWIIIGLVGDQPARLRVTDLAKALRVENPLVTKLVHDLVSENLLKTGSHRRDKRARVLSVTGKGGRLIDKIEPEVRKALATIEVGASPADWNTYFATLDKIVSVTED